MQRKLFVLYCAFVFNSVKADAQNVSSPYSILGIGDIENNDYGRYSASGSAAVTRREAGYYNFSNPASLTVMLYKSINYDFSFRGRVSQFKLPTADTLTGASKDFVIKRITLAFKLKPTVGIAVGLKPFSSVNYKYKTNGSINDVNTDYTKYADGSGGIYQAYFSIGKELKKRLSVGATVSWLFGSLQNSIEYYKESIGLDIIKNENSFYYGAGLQSGIQYYSLPEKKWQHVIGITTAVYTNLKGQNTTDYEENGNSIKTLESKNIKFKLPASFSAGYSIFNKSGISFHFQGTYHKWPTQKLSYNNAFVKDSYGVHLGMEYAKKIQASNNTLEKYYIGWGIKMEQTYLVVNNNNIRDYAITLGGGKNLSRFISLSVGFEAGKKGEASLKQIQDNYYQFSIGLTVKDFWFGTKKFGRFR